MKTEKIYTVCQLVNYLRGLHYLQTYRQGTSDAYYNPRNRQHILLPVDRNIELAEKEVIELFAHSKATDMPPELEYNRFILYVHLMYTH